ncbi:glycoside hydrolase superfamily [Aspergillus varians]
MTLPASYQFLQYFDIVKLEKSVDFSNMKTYDLHGAWDRGNKRRGPCLNAHTNLTEIQDVMDLLWRNNIPSGKVVLGTGFYGRGFTVTSISCTEPGCTFESASSKGICSRQNGILFNSELMEIIEKKVLTPKLYKEAGVKAVQWDNQWVAYDDEETLELKAQFALGQALGGLMVRHGMISKTIGDDFIEYVEVHSHIDQCELTNCGEPCPRGYQPAIRTDKDNRGFELVLGTAACDETLHMLCCPENKEQMDEEACMRDSLREFLKNPTCPNSQTSSLGQEL